MKKNFSGFSPTYQNKMQEEGAQNIVNINKIKFEPYCDFADQGFLQHNENLIKTQEPVNQIKNDETTWANNPNQNDWKDTEANKTSGSPNVMMRILPDVEISKDVDLSNSEQREVYKKKWIGL